MNPEEQILQTWQTNASAWTKAIRNEIIESRKLVTNEAIITTIAQLQPKEVLDIGCGEGWLCRALQKHQISTAGIDAIHALIQSAQQQGTGRFEVCSYQDLVANKFHSNISFDIVVFNFSLFGENLVLEMLKSLRKYFVQNGKLVIQTLHPCFFNSDQPYKDGWREGSWNGFPDEFTDPSPWYFRTMQSWIKLLHHTGYRLSELIEPLHPATQKPASVIFVCDN